MATVRQEIAGFVKRTTWPERIVFLYCVVMAVVRATSDDWGHAATYVLAAGIQFTAMSWHQEADDMRIGRLAWKSMFYELRDRKRGAL